MASEEATQAVALGRLGVLAWLARQSRGRQAGLALGVIAFLVLLPAGLATRRIGRLEGELSSLHQPQVNPLVLGLSPERAAGGATEPAVVVRLSKPPGWVVLSLELGAGGHPQYRAVLLGADDHPRWQSEAVAPNADGSVGVSFPPGFLSPGDYTLRLDGLAPDRPATAAASFRFRVLGDR